MDDFLALQQQFISLYGADSLNQLRIFHAPGRVNLIGEHTDYNGGYVFPAALTLGTTMLIRKRGDGQVGLASANFDTHKHFSISMLENTPEDSWMNYPKGVIRELQKLGIDIGGYDVLYSGAIPNGAGLSSSASIEVVTAYGLLMMEGQNADPVQIALLSQRTENEFIGVKCGIMDPFAIAMGKKDHAVLLMCDTLEYEHIPFWGGEYKLVIGNTNKKRGLVDSAYNERRAQCELAVQDLREKYPSLTLLGQLTLEQYEEAEGIIKDETVRKRARHVVEENDRVLKSIEVLKKGDLAAFGQLMNGSHVSLRDLYEVTCFELDALVEAAWQVPGVLGARMTGAGFGGCTISLVHEDSIDRFMAEVGAKYKEQTGLSASFYVCEIGDGAKEMTNV